MSKIYGRARHVQIAFLRIRPDHSIKITRLELMRVFRQRFGVADAKVARTGFERISESQRAQRGIAAGAATANHQPVTIHNPAPNQVARAVHTIVHIHDSPLPFSLSRYSLPYRCYRRSSHRAQRCHGW